VEDERLLTDHVEIDKTPGQLRESSHDQAAVDADVAEGRVGWVMIGMVKQVHESGSVGKLVEVMEF